MIGIALSILVGSVKLIMSKKIERKVLLISLTILVSLLLVIAATLVFRPSQVAFETEPDGTYRFSTQESEDWSRNIPFKPIVNSEAFKDLLSEDEARHLRETVNRTLLENFPDKAFIFIDWVWISDRVIPSILICWEELAENEQGYARSVPEGFPRLSREGFCWKVGVEETQKEALWNFLAEYTTEDKKADWSGQDIEPIVGVVELTDGPTSFGGKYLRYREYLAFLQGLHITASRCNNEVLAKGVEEVCTILRKQLRLQVRKEDRKGH
jgi:hypothetical protein